VNAYHASRFTHATDEANMPSILQEGLHPKYAGTDKGATYARDPGNTKMIDAAKQTGVHLAPVGISQNPYGTGYLRDMGKNPVVMRVFLTNEQVGKLVDDPKSSKSASRGMREVIPPHQLKPPKAQLRKPNDIQTRLTVKDRKRKLLPIIATHMQNPHHTVPELEALYKQASEGGYISDKDEF
jgi:hypothetical protein